MKEAFKKLKDRFAKKAQNVGGVLCEQTAEGYVDTGVKVIIGVVIGTLILSSLYMLFKDTIFATLSTKIAGLFNYTGV